MPLDDLRAAGEDEGLALDDSGNPRGEPFDADRFAQPAADSDAREGRVDVDAEPCRELRAVADLRMRVERQVVRDEAQVGTEERLEPPAQTTVDDERLVPPEEAVVDEHQLRPEPGRALEELARRGDAGDDPRDLVRARHLEAGRPEFRPFFDLEQLVRVADDLVPGRHGGRYSMSASGCGAAW